MMAKVKELGTVKVVHKSGIVETDQGIRSTIKAQRGDRLVQDVNTRVVSIASSKKEDAKVKEKAGSADQTLLDQGDKQ
jgi:Mn-dependent DtxR family transcriptional regulator